MICVYDVSAYYNPLNNTEVLFFAASSVTMETKRDVNKLNKLIQIIYDSCVNWKNNKPTGQTCNIYRTHWINIYNSNVQFRKTKNGNLLLWVVKMLTLSSSFSPLLRCIEELFLLFRRFISRKGFVFFSFSEKVRKRKSIFEMLLNQYENRCGPLHTFDIWIKMWVGRETLHTMKCAVLCYFP